MHEAKLYDGQTAYDHDVGLAVEGERLAISLPTGETDWVDIADLAIVEEDRRDLTLSRKDHHGWRLIVPQPVDPALRSQLKSPSRYGGWIDRFGLAKASVALGAIAVAIVGVGYAAPAWIAPYVPESWERNLGTALVGDFGDNACHTPEASRAMARMERRVSGSQPAPAAMTILDISMFNAAALPGGQIVIFDGALSETDNPDAMAGILAHELSHVRRRHVTQALIRELGIGALIRLFAGDVGASAEQIVSLSYTRSNEEEADADAVAALTRANIDPRPTGKLFTKLSKMSGKLENVEFLNSHPKTKERAAAFMASYDPKAAYAPSITAQDYKAMKAACGDPDEEADEDK